MAEDSLTSAGPRLTLRAMHLKPSPVGKPARWAQLFRGLPPVLVPCLIALVLAAPCFTFPFLWDDFDFLGRSTSLHLRDLLPDPQTIFYRPISRELYFGFLNLLGSAPVIGHLLNAGFLVAVIWLLYALVRELAGHRAGFFAGLLLSGMGALPILVGWVSGVQDLLAMAFMLGAILSELRGRTVRAPCLFLCALLAKESALAFLPAAVFARYVSAARLGPLLRAGVIYGALATAWAGLHPATRLILAGGLAGPADGYLASPSAPQVGSLKAAMFTMLNVPLGPPSIAELGLLLPAFVAAAPLLLFGHLCARSAARFASPVNIRLLPIVIMASLMIVPPLLTSLLLRYWAPYQSCMPALGIAVLGGPCLTGLKARTASVLVAVYLCMGLWCRTVWMSPTVTTEPNLRATGSALTTVERGFKHLRPRFPARSNIYVSAQLGGASSVYHHLYRFQLLRVWYREPSLYVLHPYSNRSGGRAEYLFWVTPRFEVIEIDLADLHPRTSGSIPELVQYQKTLRKYALGRAAAGRVDDAVKILTTIPETRQLLQIYDRRLAAAVLIFAGRDADAERLLRQVPQLAREPALDSIMEILHESVPGLALDDATMRAFGISPEDLNANRSLMRAFEKYGFAEPAVRFARRVHALSPRDPDAARVLERWPSIPGPPRITVPIPHD